MKTWFAIPTANPVQCAETFAIWKEMGYSTAALVDGDIVAVKNADLTIRIPEWLGYPHAIKVLCERLDEPGVDWIVTGGDDVFPATNMDAETIAKQCTEHFGGTMGVMQPCGDMQGINASGLPAAARICGSPWMGREFRRRWNQGNGPFHLGHFHYFCDESLKEETEAAGILWMRPDLCQLHNHWSFAGKKKPSYLMKADSLWARDEALFRQRKAAGFPGHEPLAAALSI